MGYQRLRWRIRVANAGQGAARLALWRDSAPPVAPNLVTRAIANRGYVLASGLTFAGAVPVKPRRSARAIAIRA
jgi:hypothetical protein